MLGTLRGSARLGALLLVAGGCRDSEGTRATERVGSAPNPLLAAVTKELRAFNPNLDRFAIMDLRVVDAFRGKGYVTIGYGVRDTSSYPGQMRDEAFGVFAVNDSLNRIWKTFEIIPTQRWRDWALHITIATGVDVVVTGHSIDYGPAIDSMSRAYRWPCSRYSDPPDPLEDSTTESCPAEYPK